VADARKGLQIVDFSRLGRLAAPQTVDTPGYAYGLALAGDRLLVADGLAGLQVVAMDAAGRMDIVGTVDTPGCAKDVVMGGERVYVADAPRHVRALDLSDNRGRIIDSLCLPGAPAALCHDDGWLYVADGGGGLQIVKTDVRGRMRLAASLSLPGYTRDVVVVKGYAYIACGKSGLLVADVRQPRDPTLIGPVAIPDHLRSLCHAMAVAVADNRLFVAGGSAGLLVFDLSHPSQPQLIDSSGILGYAMALAVAGDRVFVADLQNGLQMVDCHEFDHMRVVGALGASIKMRGMVVRDKEVFFSAGWGGVMTLPLPRSLDRRSFHGSDRLVYYPPSLEKKGYYSLCLFNGAESLVLPDVLFFDGRAIVARPMGQPAAGHP
jgi:hypothetical protein